MRVEVWQTNLKWRVMEEGEVLRARLLSGQQDAAMRQMQIARELLQSGYTIETFLEDAAGVIKWKHTKNQQPPYSLQYFMSRKVSQQRAKTGKSAEDIIKQMANKMRLPK